MKRYNEYITESKSKEHPLLISAKGGGNTGVKKHLKNGADINMKNKDGRTPLMLAIIGNYIMVVKTLIDAGADVNIKENDGRVALSLVNTPKILDMVLNYGANVNSQSNDGLTPLMEFVYYYKSYDLKLNVYLQKFLEHDLDLDVESDNGLNTYEQVRKWMKEDNIVQQYLDENYPQYKERYDMKNNIDNFNI